MIRMKSGVYGSNPPKRAGDKPFSLSSAEEARLVKMGVAAYVDKPIEPSEQDDPNMDPVGDLAGDSVDNGAPIGFDEMPPEDFVEDAEDEAEVVEEPIDLETLTVNVLRELGEEYGLTFKANAKKAYMIKAITEAQAQIAEDGEDAPTFDAAEAVE